VNVSRVTIDERDGEPARSARVTWADGEFTLWCRGPAGLIDRSDDASAFFCAALPVAMVIGEPLTVEGPVSTTLAARGPEIQTAYRAWNPEWTVIPLTVEAVSDPPRTPGPAPSASFFSRGVDSAFAAACGVADLLLFGDHLEPRHDADVRSAEIERARVAAEVVDRPLVVVDSNVRAFTDHFGTDWEDVCAAGLSFVAHNIAAGISRAVIPSSDSYGTVEPCGTNPLLDPLFSTDAVAIEHGSITHTRLDKIRWIATHAPALLPTLKVCYSQNRPDNCGQCGKCVYTMLCLHVAGVLPQATEFPAQLDVDRIRSLRFPQLKARTDWAEVACELSTTGPDGVLRDAILTAMKASTVSARYQATTADPWVPHRWTRDNWINLALSLVLDGDLSPDTNDAGRLGLLEIWQHERPRYELGALPHPGTARLLGALVARPLPGAIPVWMTADGEVRTRGMRPPPATPRAAQWRWALRPVWAGSTEGRLRAAYRRTQSVRRTARPPDDVTTDPPHGYLHQSDAPGRRPLSIAWHPVLGHQILETDGVNPDAALLGYLEPPPLP
jgi:hypothetical protein